MQKSKLRFVAVGEEVTPMELNWESGALAKGLQCYRQGEFFAAHEHWEAVWLAAPEPERTFLQAVIQVAAAFHHHGRGNKKGTRSLLEAALLRLEKFPTAFAGLRVSVLREEIRGCLRALDTFGTSEVVPPRIAPNR